MSDVVTRRDVLDGIDRARNALRAGFADAGVHLPGSGHASTEAAGRVTGHMLLHNLAELLGEVHRGFRLLNASGGQSTGQEGIRMGIQIKDDATEATRLVVHEQDRFGNNIPTALSGKWSMSDADGVVSGTDNGDGTYDVRPAGAGKLGVAVLSWADADGKFSGTESIEVVTGDVAQVVIAPASVTPPGAPAAPTPAAPADPAPAAPAADPAAAPSTPPPADPAPATPAVSTRQPRPRK